METLWKDLGTLNVSFCVCTGLCACTCVCMWRPEDILSGHSSRGTYLVFETGPLTILELTSCARLAEQQAPGFLSPSSWCTMHVHNIMPSSFTWFLGIHTTNPPHLCPAVKLPKPPPKPKIPLRKSGSLSLLILACPGFCGELFNVRINNITVNNASWLSCSVSISKILKHLIVSTVWSMPGLEPDWLVLHPGSVFTSCEKLPFTFLYGLSEVRLHVEFRSLCLQLFPEELSPQPAIQLWPAVCPFWYVPQTVEEEQSHGEKGGQSSLLLIGLTLCSGSFVSKFPDFNPKPNLAITATTTALLLVFWDVLWVSPEVPWEPYKTAHMSQMGEAQVASKSTLRSVS